VPSQIGADVVTPLVFCFVLAYLSSMIGLAPIVGAYAAGLILEDAHFRSFANRGEQQLERLVHPLSTFLVPVFFVAMGMRVDLTAFGRIDVLGLAALLTLAGQPVVDQAIFSAVVIMVIVATMATPPLLKWSLARRS
jgi:Kef-type K+ transport system membrane component KefB